MSSNGNDRKKKKGKRFDWDKEWYAGESPAFQRVTWKDRVREHPGVFLMMLALGTMVLVAITVW